MKQDYYGFLAGWMIVLVLLGGCDRKTEYHPVNLEEKLSENRPVPSGMDQKTLRVAVAAMISPKDTLVYYEALVNYIGEKLGYDIVMVQRKTYSEVNELFSKGRVDMAFVCSGPYANGKDTYGFEGIATPVIRNEPYYQSYLIVHKTSSYDSFEDLGGKRFAFTDPDSNTGALVPRFWLLEKNETPTSFFSQVIYTFSHDNSILAVARGLVDGATVDGHKWEFFTAKSPEFTSDTRVIKKSDWYGNPPLVVSSSLDNRLKSGIQTVVLSMHTAVKGKEILDNLMIDRFEIPKEEWYENIRIMHAKVQQKQ